MTTEADLKRRARLGLIALSVRSVLQNVVILVANVYLARLLAPGDYGIFGILQFALSLLKLVGDTGLGAALVQKKEAPDDIELSSIWWLQLAIGVLLVAVSLTSVPLLPLVWPTLSGEIAWLMPALSVSLLFTMLRAVPFLMLERQVQFGWVGLIEFLGTLVYYGTAVTLAKLQFGVAALVWATVGQSALISIVANLVMPWRPKLTYDHSRVRSLLKFGFAFQGNNIVGFVNGSLTPLLVGARLGKEALGVVQFAQGTAWFPTHPVGVVRRVYFPYLSRLQHDPTAFARELDKATLLCAIPACLFAGLFLGGAPAIVEIIYSPKWLPAVAPLYVYSIGFVFNFYSWIGGAAIEALGQTSNIFRVAVVGTLVNWSACVLATSFAPTPLAFALGFLLHLIVSVGMVVYMVRNAVPEARPFSQLPALLAAMGGVAVLGRAVLPWVKGPWTLGLWMFGAILCFAAISLALDRRIRGLAYDAWRKFRGDKSQVEG